MDFTAIDFETATRYPDSACQLAAVRVRGGEIVDQASWLIRPQPLSFSPMNIQVHGITPAMVREEPSFGELWPEIYRMIGAETLIAHNASFDMGVLIACLNSHGHPVPEMRYSCTRAIARRAWPDQPRFGLKPLSDWLGIQFRHHDALEDSIACAKVALAAATDLNVESLEALEEKLRLSRGTAGPWGKKGPAAARRRKTRAKSPSFANAPDVAKQPAATPAEMGWSKACSDTDVQRLMVRAELIRPLQGNRVVFTGTMCRIDRDEAELLAIRGGGQCQATVSKQTNLLVVGQTDSRTRQAGRDCSVKEAKARKLQAEGANVKIITEEEFLQMIAVVD